MKKITSISIAFVLMIAVVLFASCGGPEAEQPEEQVDYEIALVTDAGLLMNGGYSEVAWNTISEFGASEGISHKYYKAAEATESAYDETIKTAVSKGAKIIVADGYSFENVVFDLQKEYPDVKFVLIDAEPRDEDTGKSKIAENTADIVFASEQAGYLAGYTAVRTGFKRLGFIGDEEKKMIVDYGYGFLQGADRAAKELNTTVSVRYAYGAHDDDAEVLSQRATKWYEKRTQIIFACGSHADLAVTEAAELTEKRVISSETDKQSMSDTIVASAVKNFEAALNKILEQYVDDEFPGGREVAYTVDDEGISFVYDEDVFKNFDDALYDTVVDEMKSGSLKIKKCGDGSISSLKLTNVKVK